MTNPVGASPHSGRRVWAELSAVLLLAGVTVADYLAWLGWDQRRDVSSDGQGSGPYQPWQVAGLVLVLAVVGISAIWLGYRRATVFAIPVALTAAVSVDWSPDDESGLWVVGAFMVFIGTLAVTAVVGGIMALIKRPTRS